MSPAPETASETAPEIKASDLPFSCRCGAVAGVIRKASPAEGDHVVCHCTDCRDLVRLMGKEDRFLDANGGTALYQSRCARVRIDSGKDRLACLHMTDAPVLRWYAACCDTPLFNSYANGKIPYVTSLIANCPSERAEALLGPPKGHLFTEEATGDVGDAPKMSMGKLMRRFGRRMIKDIISGDRRRSALFDARTLKPIATPHHLTADQRRALGRA